MTLSQALQTIHKHWQVLPHENKDGHEAVWIRIPPEDAAEVYAEWVGMQSDGSFIWAYTLGYGYGEGTQEPASRKEVQVLQCVRCTPLSRQFETKIKIVCYRYEP